MGRRSLDRGYVPQSPSVSSVISVSLKDAKRLISFPKTDVYIPRCDREEEEEENHLPWRPQRKIRSYVNPAKNRKTRIVDEIRTLPSERLPSKQRERMEMLERREKERRRKSMAKLPKMMAKSLSTYRNSAYMHTNDIRPSAAHKIINKPKTTISTSSKVVAPQKPPTKTQNIAVDSSSESSESEDCNEDDEESESSESDSCNGRDLVGHQKQKNRKNPVEKPPQKYRRVVPMSSSESSDSEGGREESSGGRGLMGFKKEKDQQSSSMIEHNKTVNYGSFEDPICID